VPQMIKRICFSCLALFLLLTLSGCASPSTTTETVRVIEVIDGDTIVIEGDYYVRYIGMDAPELRPTPEPYAAEAWQANRQLVEGKEVRLERDISETDRYGRLLRYVWVDDVMVNAELVKQGLALAKAYPPDTKYQDLLERIEREARDAGRGMWTK